jgi:hypothetical protein
MSSTVDCWIEHLKRIKNNAFNTGYGVCANVSIRQVALQFGFRKWPKFSGLTDYPIPHFKFTPIRAFHYAQSREILWDKETQYGWDRWELVDFLIEFYKQCEMFVVSNTSVTPADDYIQCNEDVFRVLVHIPSVPKDLQDLEFLVQCWHDKKLLEQYPSFCVEI